MPTQLDNVSATVNGKPAFVYYISPLQVNILTPPDALSGHGPGGRDVQRSDQRRVHRSAQSLSPSFFVFDGEHVAAKHLNGTDMGPTSLYPGLTTPAKPNENVVLYANGFGPTSQAVVSGSISQGGTLSPLPVVTIADNAARVLYAGLAAAGEFQFNVIVPLNTPDGDQPIVATYGGMSTQAGAVITVQH